MNVRTPQGSIAWAVSLVTVPFVTVPAYWIFGRSKFHGYVLARRADADLIDEIAERAMQGIERLEAQTEWGESAIRGTERLARLPFSGSNSVELLVDGEATFDSIFAGIDQAETYVLVQFYIVHADDIGNQLKDRLDRRCASRRQRAVPVRRGRQPRAGERLTFRRFAAPASPYCRFTAARDRAIASS